ncbi:MULTISPECIES: helix-turn-helix domain-containing protein [Clostridiaceae]|uniref:Helix-turn-helix transcriptional regulator n=1 Tax=Clostridium facile TaxID=2763035 RepID=A0ABR7INY1_9CLOT|nr:MULTISPECIES: helix-turn-helix transcriptional regulator [Clostridiaceae]MBC5786779.1 helix-turn-helix transcriptional regulator [Clostridium facile]
METFERIRLLRKKYLNMTQEEFSSNINISRANLGSIEVGRIRITDRVISDICIKYNVSEEWLRTGEGEPFIKLTRDEELMEWAGKVLSADSKSFQKRFVSMLSRLNESEWQVLEKMAIELTENKKD